MVWPAAVTIGCGRMWDADGRPTNSARSPVTALAIEAVQNRFKAASARTTPRPACPLVPGSSAQPCRRRACSPPLTVRVRPCSALDSLRHLGSGCATTAAGRPRTKELHRPLLGARYLGTTGRDAVAQPAGGRRKGHGRNERQGHLTGEIFQQRSPGADEYGAHDEHDVLHQPGGEQLTRQPPAGQQDDVFASQSQRFDGGWRSRLDT
jgi:hypothetical protein